jgi:hypothetical protein
MSVFLPGVILRWAHWTRGGDPVLIVLAVEVLVALMIIAVLGVLVSAAWWLLVSLLLVFSVKKYLDDRKIRQYEADRQAGRVKPFDGVERCQDCQNELVPCDDCSHRYKVAHNLI